MALTEQTRVRQIILDFPTAEGYTLRYREAVDLMRDGVFDQELRVSEPMPVIGVGEPLPSALAELFGQEAGKIILGSHKAAIEHEDRLQELADETRRADAAEQQVLEQSRRADAAEAKLAAVMKALSPDSAMQTLDQ